MDPLYVLHSPLWALVTKSPQADIPYIQYPATYGYLTLNNTRKVVLLLETDPATRILPIVGAWVSIYESNNRIDSNNESHEYEIVDNLIVWAACVRFLSTARLRVRKGILKEVLWADEKLSTFLLVLYT